MLVGSVKTNIGHLEAASGIAGLLKVALALQHREIPAHLHFETPTPHVPWQELPLKIPTKRTGWESGEKKRIAGVSSFGLSGINAHVILEEAPASTVESAIEAASARILALSAKAEHALHDLLGHYRALFSGDSQPLWRDVCFTANAGRTHFGHRVAVVAESLADAGSLLETASSRSWHVPPRIAFVISKELLPEIGRELCEAYPAFRRMLEKCEQNVSFAIAELWRFWGVQPDVITGERGSEYLARYAQGEFEYESNIETVRRRGIGVFLALGDSLPLDEQGTWLPAPERGRAWRSVLDALSALYSQAHRSTGPGSKVDMRSKANVSRCRHILSSDGATGLSKIRIRTTLQRTRAWPQMRSVNQAILRDSYVRLFRRIARRW